jgi:hypothetical protein
MALQGSIRGVVLDILWKQQAHEVLLRSFLPELSVQRQVCANYYTGGFLWLIRIYRTSSIIVGRYFVTIEKDTSFWK